jgi:hypothetical protein
MEWTDEYCITEINNKEIEVFVIMSRLQSSELEDM